MPELPEVEIVRRGLEELAVGQTIKTVRVLEAPKSYPNSPNDSRQFVEGAKIVAVRRRAKLLLIDLSSNYTLVTHLKMTGQLVYVSNLAACGSLDAGAVTPRAIPLSDSSQQEIRFGAGHPTDSLIGKLPDRSTRIIFELTGDAKLFFNDQRKFGWIKLVPTNLVPEMLFMKKVGPEPLDDTFGSQQFIERLRRRQGATIKAALLDQTVLAGVGNIYADESLWGAQIHPATRVRDLGDDQLGRLLEEVKYVLQLSIDKGGSSSRNYVNAQGEKGRYIDFARVYRREGQACPRHPGVLVEKIRVAGRGTHICPVCQPTPDDMIEL